MYSWHQKMVTLNMETFRRHKNTSRQVSWPRRTQILINYVKKLHASGYSVRTVSNVIREGSKYYYRKLRADLEGGPPLNQSVTDYLIKSQRSKLGASESWFQRRRGGAKECEKKYHGWRTAKPGRGKRPDAGVNRSGEDTGAQDQPMDPEASLLVPFTVDSELKRKIQAAEGKFSSLTR